MSDTLLKKITGLKKRVDKYKNLTDTNWVTHTFKKKFIVENGQVKLRPRTKAQAPEPPPQPAQSYSASRTG